MPRQKIHRPVEYQHNRRSQGSANERDEQRDTGRDWFAEGDRLRLVNRGVPVVTDCSDYGARSLKYLMLIVCDVLSQEYVCVTDRH